MGCNVSSGGCNAVDAAMLLLKNGGGGGGGVTPEEMAAALSVKADKVPDGTAGNFAALDGAGNLVDSGRKPADFGSAKDVEILYKLAKGQIYDTETDTQEAYQKTVPSGASAAEIGSIGGKTVVWNQLTQNADFSEGKTNWTPHEYPTTSTVDAGILRVTSSGTYPYGDVSQYIPSGTLGHKILLIMRVRAFGDTLPIFRVYRNGGYSANYEITTDFSTEKLIFENSGSYYGVAMHSANLDKSNGIEVDYVFAVDLTTMFGSGNEPTTTDDPRIAAIEAYAALNPEYNAGALLSADVAELVSRDGSQQELGRLSIPTALRAAYPLRSTRNAADTYDFSDGTYEQNVYEYTFTGNETISHQGTLTDVVHTSFSPAANGLPEMHNFGAVYGGDLLSAAIPFRADQSNTVHVTCRNDTIRLFTPSDFGTGSTVEKCKAYLKYLYDSGNPLTVVYVRKEPAESDISAHIPDNLLLKTEAGGTLTFVQDGTQFPVPNSVDYLVKLSEVEP